MKKEKSRCMSSSRTHELTELEIMFQHRRPGTRAISTGFFMLQRQLVWPGLSDPSSQRLPRKINSNLHGKVAIRHRFDGLYADNTSDQIDLLKSLGPATGNLNHVPRRVSLSAEMLIFLPIVE